MVATVLAGLPLLRSPFPAFADGAPANAPTLTNRVLELTNSERARAGLSALSVSPQLSQAAQQYSNVLSTDACFAHTCGPVPDLTQRDAQVGYDGWTAVGENIAAGYPTPEAVVAGWMNSQGHRENILSRGYSEIGLGLAAGGKYGSYWTQEFGNRPSSVSMPAFLALPATDASDASVSDDDGQDGN